MSTYNYVPQYGQTGFVPGQAPYYNNPYTNAYQNGFQQQPMVQQPAPTPMMQSNVNVRMVTSREEAIAAQIPFDATVNIFANLASGEVYIKRFNIQTGKADFDVFKQQIEQAVQPHQQAIQQPVTPPVEYVPLDAFQRLEGRVGELAETVNGIENRAAQKKPSPAQKPVKED